MTYKQGLFIAQINYLEGEYNSSYYESPTKEDESTRVLRALREWDIKPAGEPEITFNGCDELVRWMLSKETQKTLAERKASVGARMTVEFEGYITEICDIEPNLDDGLLLIRDNCIFLISNTEYGSFFHVQCLPNGSKPIDCFLTLPAYAKQELIATIKGQ